MMRPYHLILGIPSIALLFLPYAYGVSPWATVSGQWWSFALLGGPFFLSIPILIAQTRAFLKRPFSKGGRVAYRLLAGAALAAGLVFLGNGFWTEGFSQEAILWSSVWSIPCAAAVWIMILSARKLKPEKPEDATTTTVMLTGKIALSMQAGSLAAGIYGYRVLLTYNCHRQRGSPWDYRFPLLRGL